MISVIAGLTKKRIIGKNGTLPWHISEDLKNFKRVTEDSTIVMGRKTYESIGGPLPNRHNIIVSSTMTPKEGIEISKSFEEAMEKAKEQNNEIFIIGGTSMFAKGLEVADRLYLSWVKEEYEGDTYFPEFNLNAWNIKEEKDFGEFVFIEYSRK